MTRVIDSLEASVKNIETYRVSGKVTKVLGLMAEITGLGEHATIGSVCTLEPKGLEPIYCEVVGFNDGRAQLMPFGTLEGVGLGCQAFLKPDGPTVAPDQSWLGRTVFSYWSRSSRQTNIRSVDVLRPWHGE